MELLEERGERLLRVYVDTGGRLVEDEQVRMRCKGLGQERTLLLSAREPAQDRPALVRETHPLDRLVDERAIAAPEEPSRHQAALDDLANRDGCVDAELGSLREVANPSSSFELVCRFSEEERLASSRLLEPDGDAQKRRLAAAVRPCDGDELAGLDLEVDVVQYLGPTRVREADVTQLDG